ncbi:hypothetical protein [Kribbella sp. DT2]|uniref:hypothetical protein n=1 Tax=Kribbella sp. DT2 TaxID=3393427 RepID=UPI003CF30EA7
MKNRIGRVVAGVAALAAALVATTAGNALAAERITYDHTFTDAGVKVQVKENGDVITVCDTKKNGQPAWVSVQVDGVTEYDIVNKGGYGTCRTARASNGGRRDLAEGWTIHLYFDGDGVGNPAHKSYLNDH